MSKDKWKDKPIPKEPFGNYGKNCPICKGTCIGHGDY